MVIQGCGGAPFTGSLTGRDGNGTIAAPVAAAGQAQITALSPSVIAAGSAGFTLTVTGVNFLPSTVVLWDGSQPLTTTYVSSTMLRAEVSTALISYAQGLTITPSPRGTFNYGSYFTVTAAKLAGNKALTVMRVSAQANDMVALPSGDQLYLAMSNGDANRPSVITALNPQTGQFGTAAASVSAANQLAISQDGAYLYGSHSDFSVRRYQLPALRLDATVPLVVGSYTKYTAADLQVQPTNSRTVAVARLAGDVNYPVQGDVVVYDDAVARAQTATSGTNLQINRLTWNSNGQTLYGTNGIGILYSIAVAANGVQLSSKLDVKASLSDSLRFEAATGNLYSAIGGVIEPGTGSTVTNFPVNALGSGFNAGALLVTDGKLKLAYFLGRTIDGGTTGDYVIEAFDLTRYNLVGAATIPNVTGKPLRFVRWGSNGLAFLTTDTTGTGGAVYLISGEFVTSPAP